MTQTRNGLIGHTGFLGGNLVRQAPFDACFHSKNIGEIRGQEFDLLVCGGITAVKWWANQNPAEDRARIESLVENLKAVRAKRFIVLSTVDVYPRNQGADETFDCHSLPNHAYGTNRLYFEEAVSRLFEDVLIVRISGVFGPGLKKNVIFDLLHDNCLDAINPDCRFQYYNVGRLWRDLETAQQAGLRLVNFVGAPLRTGELIERFFPGKMVGAKAGPAIHYDLRTLHSATFGGPAGYLTSEADTLRDISAFVAAA